MKKTIIASLFVSIGFFFISCSSGKTYELKMKLAQGDHFEQNTKMDMKMHYKVMEQEMNMKMGMDMACFFDVLKSTPDEKQLKMTYSRAKMTMDMGQLNNMINTDSLLDKTNNKMVGKSITLILVKDNEIKDVIGMDLPENEDSDPQTKEMMKKMFSKEQINSLFGMIFNLYPNKPVAIGDSWEKENKVNLGEFEMKMKTKYKLISIENGLASVEVDGTIKGKGSMVTNKMEMNMNGTQKGTLNVKLADGYLDKGKYTMSLTADMEMSGIKVPMTIVGEYTVSGK